MKSTIPAPAAKLLDFIAKYESGGNYLAYYGHAKNLTPLAATLDGVLAWQKEYIAQGHRSSAIGRYQFMGPTLQSLMSMYKIAGATAFTTDLQDELAMYLLQRRGYDYWITGTYSDAEFADKLSEEWASMPYHTGRSYYDGDHLNSALVSRADFMAEIAAAKQEKSMTGATGATGPVHKAASGGGVANVLEGLVQMVENTVSGIASGIQVAVSPNNSVTIGASTGGAFGGVFSSISNAQLAISELGAIVADAKSGKWQNEPQDIFTFLQTVLGTLSKFGINIPVLSALIEAMPTLPAVQSPTGTAATSGA